MQVIFKMKPYLIFYSQDVNRPDYLKYGGDNILNQLKMQNFF